MTNDKVKLSVLITAYDLETCIGQTLDSVVGQVYDAGYEILVGDDGSHDGTVGIVKEYADRYPGLIKLFEREREEGIEYSRIERASMNRIMLLKEAKGEYISFLDGDDLYTDMHRLKKLSDILDDPANADCSMAAHNLYMYYPDGSTVPLCRAKRERKIGFPEYWKLMFLQSGALMFRKGDISDLDSGKLKYDYDDNLITFRQFMRGKMYYLPECMALYRQTEGSSWNAMDELAHAYVNIVSMGMEKALAPGKEKIINIRHYPDLKAAYKGRDTADEKLKERYAGWAEELGLEESGRIIRSGTGLKEMLPGAAAGYCLARIQRAFRKLAGRY